METTQPSDSKNSQLNPFLLIAFVDFGTQVMWRLVFRLIPDFYTSSFYLILQIASSTAILVLCAIFIGKKEQRSIIIILIVLLVGLDLSQKLFF